MLIICVQCRRIIGCGIDKQGKIEHQCSNCVRYDACIKETPLQSCVERHVYFVHFANGCSDHERVKIGFKRNETHDGC